MYRRHSAHCTLAGACECPGHTHMPANSLAMNVLVPGLAKGTVSESILGAEGPVMQGQ